MELTKKHLNNIINKLELVNSPTRKPDQKELLESLLNVLLVLYFGESNTDYIYRFAKGDRNTFSNIDQLFEYLSDKYSELVRKDSALTIDQLKQLFPEEQMFKYFKSCIDKLKDGH